MLLEEWLADAQLQALAAQHNLSETAFLVRQSEAVYELRWFTLLSKCPCAGMRRWRLLMCSLESWVQVMVQCSSTHDLGVSWLLELRVI